MCSSDLRIAGSPNVKHKYAPEFPAVRIETIHSGRIVELTEIEEFFPKLQQNAADCESPAQHLPNPRWKDSRRTHAGSHPITETTGDAPDWCQTNRWPDYAQCLRGAPATLAGNPDRSRADFLWSKWALERGHYFGEVVAKLVEVSEKARQESKHGNLRYAMRTVEAAEEALGR